MKILVINGPNLNLLGLREPAIYGSQSYAALLEKIQAFCDKEGVEVSFFQSNHEGAIVDEIQAAYGVYDGIVINPAAYTHTSVAILDALKAVAIPAVEVHISDVDAREPFRQVSYAGMACVKTYKGLGFDGYIEAVPVFGGLSGMISQKMINWGSQGCGIREIAAYGEARAAVVGAENVFNFTIGNPSVKAPDCVARSIRHLLDTVPAGGAARVYARARAFTRCGRQWRSSLRSRSGHRTARRTSS